MAGKRLKIHNLDRHPTADFNEFIELQDDFKTRTREQIDKLKNRIIEVGFKYDFIVWENKKGDKFIVDAHARKEILKELVIDGYEIPPVPYTRIHAKNKTEAKKEILHLNSKYGTIDPDSEFLKINLDDFDLNVNLEINMFEETEEQDYSQKNKEIDTDEFSDKMSLTFDLDEDEYNFVTDYLSKKNANKEIALLEILNYE